MYRLRIEKFIPNPNYKEELKTADMTGMFWRPGAPGPQLETIVRSLEVEITDEQFEAVRKAVIAVM
jgi:hypothetical protein